MSVTRFSFNQQWGHVGSEIGRAISRKKINDEISYAKSLERALDMLDEMKNAHRGVHNLRELTRFREFLASHYVGEQSMLVSLEELEQYCNKFAIAESTRYTAAI